MRERTPEAFNDLEGRESASLHEYDGIGLGDPALVFGGRVSLARHLGPFRDVGPPMCAPPPCPSVVWRSLTAAAVTIKAAGRIAKLSRSATKKIDARHIAERALAVVVM